MPEPDWANLGRAIRARRRALGAPRQADLASQAGVSDTTWNLAETGKVVGERSLAKIALVLGWAPEVIDHLLEGGDAPPLGRQLPEPVAERTDYNSRIARMPEHARRAVDALIDAFEAEQT